MPKRKQRASDGSGSGTWWPASSHHFSATNSRDKHCDSHRSSSLCNKTRSKIAPQVGVKLMDKCWVRAEHQLEGSHRHGNTQETPSPRPATAVPTTSLPQPTASRLSIPAKAQDYFSQLENMFPSGKWCRPQVPGDPPATGAPTSQVHPTPLLHERPKFIVMKHLISHMDDIPLSIKMSAKYRTVQLILKKGSTGSLI